MEGLLVPTAALGVLVAQFFLIVARLSLVVFLMPGLGEQAVTMRARVLILLALSAAALTLTPMPYVSVTPFAGYLALIAGEVAIGFFLGASLRLAIWLLSIVGTIIAQSIGLAQMLGVALENEQQTIMSNILTLAGVAVLLSANYHVQAYASYLDLYNTVPVGGYGLIEPTMFMNAFFAGMNFAITLAWPFVTMGLVYNISLGFINKAMPQLMVAFVGAPFMVGAGLFLLSVSIVSLMVVWIDRVYTFLPWI